ncbi:MAG: right-handed parallel beta-helix repeat-containing protein, partial [Sedimentisphaerales bacterium]|nr:right-handed parallel beta-helix repeat-containing protein [Sedimentisphaerales bacterium]
ENNYLTSCEWGIIEYGPGHTDIINNLCFGSGYCGIYVNMESLTGVADANSHIIVQNNTCDYQERGMRIYGADNCDYAGFLELKNNLFSSSNEIGLSVMNCIYITVANTGFYNNIMDKSCTGIPDYNSVQAYVDPYIDGPGSLEHCHLNQGCPFINAGLEYIEETPLIGKTTDLADTPDSNRVDIGFHHPNWDYSNAGTTTLRADFDNSLTVDFNDLSFFTDYWLFDYNNAEEVWWWDWDDSGKIDFGDLAVVAEYWLSPFDFSEFTDFARQWQKGVDYRLFDTRPDLNADNIVDFEDFTVLASEWRQTGDAEPNLVPVISGNSNNGYVEVGVSGFTSDTQRVFLFVDGEYRREIFNFWDDYTAWTDISEFGSQERQIKLVGISKTGQITCSNIMDIAFTCPLRYCFFPRDYEPNTPLYFSAINPGPEDVSVNVYADGGDLVWSQTCSGDNIFGSIPAGITNQYELDYVSFIKGTNEPISKVTCVAVVLKNSDPGIEALIILPNEKIKLYDKKSISMVRTAFKNNSVKYQELSLFYATHDNIAWLAQNRNIKYIYITSHGHYLATENSEISRTSVELWDGWTVSVKQSDFPPGLAPSWCVELDGNLENTLNSFYTMGFTSLEFAYFDCCYSGHLQINTYGMLTDGQSGYKGVVLDEPVSDITLALGIHNPNKSRFYQGWYDKPDSRIWFFPQTAFQKWTQREWEILGYPYNLETALTMVFNEQTEFGPDSPANNFRIKGQGFFFDMILNGN